MSIKQEFKDFIMRGNVIDLAVGMVVGTAFSGIVKSLVDDVIMPPIGLLIGGVDFSNCSQCHFYGCEIIEFIEEKRKGS